SLPRVVANREDDIVVVGYSCDRSSKLQFGDIEATGPARRYRERVGLGPVALDHAVARGRSRVHRTRPLGISGDKSGGRIPHHQAPAGAVVVAQPVETDGVGRVGGLINAYIERKRFALVDAGAGGVAFDVPYGIEVRGRLDGQLLVPTPISR